MKKLTTALAVILATTAMAVPTLASTIGLRINNQFVTPGVAPFEQNGTTLVPLRIVSENLGAKVDWNAKAKTITITQEDTTVVLTVGSKSAEVNGVAKELLSAPQMKSNTTMVPIRFVSENLNCTVGWDKATQVVSVNAKDVEVVAPNEGTKVTTFKNPKVIDGVVYLTKEQMIEAFDVEIEMQLPHTAQIVRRDLHCWLLGKDWVAKKNLKVGGGGNRINWAYMPLESTTRDLWIKENNTFYYPLDYLAKYLNSEVAYNTSTKEVTVYNNGIKIYETTNERFRTVEGYVYMVDGSPAVGIKLGLGLPDVPLREIKGTVTDENGYYYLGELDTQKYPYFDVSAYGYDGEHSEIDYGGKVANPAMYNYWGKMPRYLTDASQPDCSDYAGAKFWSNIKEIPTIYVYYSELIK